MYACPGITVLEEVVIIDIPPVFGLYLPRDFTTKIGGYLSLDWSHLILRTKHGAKLKVMYEPLHTKYVADEALMNFEATYTSITREEMYCIELLEDEEVTGDRTLEQEVFLNKFIESDPFGNYHATGIETCDLQ